MPGLGRASVHPPMPSEAAEQRLQHRLLSTCPVRTAGTGLTRLTVGGGLPAHISEAPDLLLEGSRAANVRKCRFEAVQAVIPGCDPRL